MVKCQGGTSPVHQPVLVIRFAGRNELNRRPKVGTDQSKPIPITMIVRIAPDQPLLYLALACSCSTNRAVCTAAAAAGPGAGTGISVLIVFSPLLAFCEC